MTKAVPAPPMDPPNTREGSSYGGSVGRREQLSGPFKFQRILGDNSLVGTEEGVAVAAIGTEIHTGIVGMKNGEMEVMVMAEGMMTWKRDRDINREYHK
ncbi:hypothetical protein Tco_0714611 [Tanacetum coccineum]